MDNLFLNSDSESEIDPQPQVLASPEVPAPQPSVYNSESNSSGFTQPVSSLSGETMTASGFTQASESVSTDTSPTTTLDDPKLPFSSSHPLNVSRERLSRKRLLDSRSEHEAMLPRNNPWKRRKLS